MRIDGRVNYCRTVFDRITITKHFDLIAINFLLLQLSLIMYFRHKLFSQLHFAINVFFISFDRQKMSKKRRNGPYFVKKTKDRTLKEKRNF